MSFGSVHEIDDIIIEGLAQNEYTCAAWLVRSGGKILTTGAIGRLGAEESDPACRLDSIFDLASITKPVATATSLMILSERGLLKLEMPVSKFFPDFKNEATLFHLLTHTSGLPAWENLYSNRQTRDQIMEQLLQIPLKAKPGGQYEYSCLGYILLCFIIELVSGMSLSDFARENIFQPLSMRETCFNPPETLMGRIARTANCEAREEILTGIVHDGNAFGMRGVSGNAGLFSTLDDLAIYAQMLLDGGGRILSPESVRLMSNNQIDPSIGGQSIGFFTKPNDMFMMGEAFSDLSFGHSGFTGTSLVIDPEIDTFAVLLTNRVYIKRDASDYLSRRRRFHNQIASTLDHLSHPD